MLTLSTPVESINRIAKGVAKKLEKLGVQTAGDFLFYYPFRYEDFSRRVKIADLQAGMSANVRGTLDFIQNKRSPRQRMFITEALLRDESGQLRVVWFNQPFIGKSLHAGDLVSLSGTAQGGFLGLEMAGPEYERLTSLEGAGTHTTGIVPLYHLTANLTNRQVRFLVKTIISLASHIEDSLPTAWQRKYNLIPLPQALQNIHFPKSKELLEQARRRLQFEELFLVQLKAQVKKLEFKNQTAEAIRFFEKETKSFVESLPFELTNAQKKAGWEILKDMQADAPMSRLLEGDVGSGKTVTAALAMYNASLNKKQSALLVPTEILAQQHYETLIKLFKETNVSIGLFTRSNRRVNSKQQTARPPSHAKRVGQVNSKQEMMGMIENGEIAIVVGTHALIQEEIEFKNLALAVIDEQHRFGVEQRQALRSKSGNAKTVPHLLSMTATPIPRSLAQVIYGDLDLSIINEMPKGRKKISTFVVPEVKRAGAYDFIKEQIAAGRQAFVICPLINPSDKLGVKSVAEEFKKLNEHVFPHLKIAALHGRLKSGEKEKIMQAFLANEIKILVSTSVVEVGVDVPNASVMMIEGADRFGLAQLHQFRGRVGRSAHQSYCLLFTDSANEQTRTRLDTVAHSSDGFKLAEADLRRRGPGEVYGTAQKGFPEFKIATLNDAGLIKQAKAAAESIVAEGIEKYPKLLEKVKEEGGYVVG
jgi:ATP-dependent DNA helicase RecG